MYFELNRKHEGSKKNFGKPQVPKKQETGYEELRLLNSLAKEEVEELKNLLTIERSKSLSLQRKNEKLEKKLQELQELNQSMTSLLISNGKIYNPKEDFKYKTADLEEHRKNDREVYESRIRAAQHEIEVKNKELFEMGQKINHLQQQLLSHSQCEGRLSLYLSQIESLESQVYKMNSSSVVQLLEEENKLLKEQVEIFLHEKKTKVSEKDMQKLSYLILSKDKNVIDFDTLNLIKRNLGEAQAGVIEKLYEKVLNLEIENKNLMQKVIQETWTKDGSEKTDVNDGKKEGRIGEIQEKEVEFNLLRGKLEMMKEDREKGKEEVAKLNELVSGLKKKISEFERRCEFADILSFIQCEAAAIEDLLIAAADLEGDSEYLY